MRAKDVRKLAFTCWKCGHYNKPIMRHGEWFTADACEQCFHSLHVVYGSVDYPPCGGHMQPINASVRNLLYVTLEDGTDVAEAFGVRLTAIPEVTDLLCECGAVVTRWLYDHPDSGEVTRLTFGNEDRLVAA